MPLDFLVAEADLPRRLTRPGILPGELLELKLELKLARDLHVARCALCVFMGTKI